MKDKRRRWKTWIGLALLAISVGASYYWYQKKKTDEAAPRFRETQASIGDLQLTVLSTGTVQPQNRLEIKPPIAGRIEKLLVVEGSRVKRGQILAWMSSTERAALLDAARARGAAELARWEDLYRPTPIIAPISGMIIQKKVEPGQSFGNADAVLVISDRLTIRALVDETDISKIKLQQKVLVILDAYPNHSLPAVVDKIAYDSRLENNVTTYGVDVAPLEVPDFMRSGMTANVTFFVENRQQIVLLDSEALKSNGEHTFVLIKNPDPKGAPLEQEIKTGLTDGKKTEILSDLKIDQIVLVPELILSSDGEKKAGSPFSPFGGSSRPRKRN